MNIVEIFISKLKNLPSDLVAIRSAGVSVLFNKEFLSRLGFEESDSVLYVSLFQRLGEAVGVYENIITYHLRNSMEMWDYKIKIPGEIDKITNKEMMIHPLKKLFRMQ